MTTLQPDRDETAAPLAASTRMGTVRVTVSDAGRSRDFYERVLGLRCSEGDEGSLRFAAAGGEPLIEVFPNPTGAALDRRRTGLFHVAILYPDRRDLAYALLRLAWSRWPLEGASDHLVSEALYLSDPDGNGIELYRDRPRETWPRDGDTPRMATLPLDLDDLLSEAGVTPEPPDHLPPGATIGHVHLQVAELTEAESFYAGALGFDVTVRLYPGALFFSAGGYHHYVAANTWHSAGGARPDPGAIGLREFEVVLEDEAALAEALERLARAGSRPDGGLVHDPSGNAVRLRVQAP